MWDALDYVEPAADIELPGIVVIISSEVLLGSLVMYLAFFGLKKFLTCS